MVPHMVQTQQHQILGNQLARAADTTEARTTGSTLERLANASILTTNLGSQIALRARTVSHDFITSTPMNTTSANGLQRRLARLHRESGSAARAPMSQSRDLNKNQLQVPRLSWMDAKIVLLRSPQVRQVVVAPTRSHERGVLIETRVITRKRPTIGASSTSVVWSAPFAPTVRPPSGCLYANSMFVGGTPQSTP